MSLYTLGSTPLQVMAGTFNPGEPDRRKNRRTMTMQLALLGPTVDALTRQIDAIYSELRQAEQANGPVGLGSPVYFSYQPGNEPIRWPLVIGDDGSCGSLLWTDGASTRYVGNGWSAGPTLTLTTTAGADAMRIVDSTSAAVTNGASLLYRANVPGQLPARARVTVTQTGGPIIQQLRIAARSVEDMASGQFDPWVDETTASGASTVADATAVGGNHARRALSTAWQTVAQYSRPAGWANNGLFHVIPRIRDNAVRIDQPTAVQVANGTPTLAYTGETDDPHSGTPQNTTGSTYQDTSLTSVSLVFPGPVTAGNLLVVFAGSNDNTPTLTAPAGWTQAKLHRFTGTAAESPAAYDCSGWCYYKVAAGAGDTASTWTIDDGVAGLDISGVEFSGLTATPLDKAVSASASSTLSTGTLAQANELAFLFTFSAAGPALDQIPLPPIGSTPWKNVPAWSWGLTPDNPSEALATNPLAANQTGGGTNTNGHVAMQITRARSRLVPKVGATVWASSGQYGVMIVTFKALVANAGYLPLGQTYESVVCAMDAAGHVGPPSAVASGFVDYPAFFNQQPASVFTDWDAPSAGATPTQYRTFLRIAGGAWYYRNTGSTTTSYAWTSFDGATAGDPPAYRTTLSEWRVRVGMASGLTMRAQPAFTSEQADGVWHMPGTAPVRSPATVYLPPQVPRDGHDPDAWLIDLQHRNLSGQTANGDADALALFSADASVLRMKAPYTVAANRSWVYDQRWDGRESGILLNGTAEAGALDLDGSLTIGPGDTVLTFIADTASGSNVSTVTFTVQIELVPQRAFVGVG